MTLEPLLTQEDVDRKQLFRTRGGGTARPLRWNDAGYWVCQDGDSDCVFSAYPDGSNYYGHRQYVLISRIPEPAMESQVVVEKNAEIGNESWMPYSDLSAWTLFTVHGSSSVFLKTEVRNGVTPAIGLHDYYKWQAPWYANPTAYDGWKCRPLPHLRLRLVLEERT